MAIAVLTRAVIIPVDVLERKWPGGEAGYRAAAPNKTYRCDGHLAAIEFMTPGDVDYWIDKRVRPAGLHFPEKGGERDAVVVDAHEGLTTACGWIDFRRRDKWAEARLKGAPESPLTGPSGWSPEAEPETHYLDPEACGRRMKFLSVDHAVATFLDEETGKRNYIGVVNRESVALILGWRLQALWQKLSPLREAADKGPLALPETEKTLLREAAEECERISKACEPLENKSLWAAALFARMAAEWKLAARLCQLYLAGEPDDAGMWMELTWCLAEQGEHEASLEAAEKAVALAPGDAGAASNMAACLRALGRWQEALTWTDRALELDPADAIALALRDNLAD